MGPAQATGLPHHDPRTVATLNEDGTHEQA